MLSSSKEIIMKSDSLMVTETDVNGNICYANSEFCKASGYSVDELIDQPNSIVRHEDTPSVIFKLMWERISGGNSFYAFVKNKTKDGGHFWIKVFVTPVVKNGRVQKYASYDIAIEDESSLANVEKLYSMLLDYERSHSESECLTFFKNYMADRNLSYGNLVVRLTQGKQISNKSSLSIDVNSYYDDHVIYRTHVIRQVDLKMEDITVTKPCCCRFGKWLNSVKGENYTRHDEWRNVSSAHDSVHSKLQQYVDVAKSGSNESQLNSLIDSIEIDTHTVFDTLQHVIDEYED
ncbi:MAG: PAS domain S-box protein [Campylobacterota bacterium]|nr:PAS domain S-box protein [Campylobacterota bacterium]